MKSRNRLVIAFSIFGLVLLLVGITYAYFTASIEGKENVSKIADKFCSILKENNYLCGIYSSVNFFKNYFNDEIKNKVLLWIAHWTNNDKPNFNGDYGIWQYSSKGSIPGISGRVDVNIFNY